LHAAPYGDSADSRSSHAGVRIHHPDFAAPSPFPGQFGEGEGARYKCRAESPFDMLVRVGIDLAGRIFGSAAEEIMSLRVAACLRAHRESRARLKARSSSASGEGMSASDRSPSQSAPHRSGQAALSLTPETPAPIAGQLGRSLLSNNHFHAVGMALRETAVETGARLFFFTHNLHLNRSSREFALRTAGEAVAALGFWCWRQRGGKGSFLGRRAEGARPLFAAVPEQDTWGSWHSHGFLLVPACISARKTELEDALRQVPPHVQLEQGRQLQDGAVHLEAIETWEILRHYTNYATGSWNSLPSVDRCIDFFPHGRHVSRDWDPVMRRAGEILGEQQLARGHAEHRRAVRTVSLLERGEDERTAAAKRVASGGGGKPASKPHRVIPIPPKPYRAPDLPSDGVGTGYTAW
jgi:hypothetical protein